tara:strand:+ start:288 stop:497 length:210 start_codon:yes stop_codon:yes gene_type:complete
MTTNLLARLSGITPLTKTELRDLRRAGNLKKRVQLCEPETNSLHSREELAHAWKTLEQRKAQRERARRG